MDPLAFLNVFDVENFLQQIGVWCLPAIGLIVFIESGVLFPFLPGDSLLVTAAALHNPLGLNIWTIILVACVAAVAGDQVGFWLGRRFGRKLFKDDARVLRTDRLKLAEDFFEKRGPMALVVGRYVPIVRTYVPVAAGTANMRYRHFVVWNILGALTWVFSMCGVGYFLGHIPGVTHNIERIILLIVAISIAPPIISAIRSYMEAKRKAQSLDTTEEAVVPAETKS